ncbi:type I-G CRISPR-associated RAMP protein Csb1/Cas7g [Almyronema epifaneia]|uniref:Type I-U CRISPR-associated RAMP protein Csb1/Cas7u n=1 Tax=Almyronema epifaneia S1 TaxID=2991925 RepID=A0ABW6IKA9_9CYAN
MDFSALKDQTRLLIEADLAPLQGTRFQPTGFPDLGTARYKLPGENIEMVLLESPQSIANRLETTIWAGTDVVDSLKGISYVIVQQDGEVLTNSLLEAHRLNSYYILEGTDKSFFNQLKSELDFPSEGPVDFHKLAVVLARYDINSLLHGIFLAKKEIAGGRFKLARALSGFIEARNIEVVASGGVKNDLVNPSADAKKGGGNIPFHREEYAAEKITAYFSLDLAQIRGYRLGVVVEDLLIAIAIWKIQRFLERGLRLRTACDLDCTSVQVKRPQNGFELPDHQALTKALPNLVQAVTEAGIFADPPVTTVQYQAEKAGSKK